MDSRSFPISSRTQHCARAFLAISGPGRACSAARADTDTRRTERSLAKRHRRAATSRLRTGAGVANNTLDTYESENSLIWNLPSGCGSAIHHRIEVSSIEATLPFYGG